MDVGQNYWIPLGHPGFGKFGRIMIQNLRFLLGFSFLPMTMTALHGSFHGRHQELRNGGPTGSPRQAALEGLFFFLFSGELSIGLMGLDRFGLFLCDQLIVESLKEFDQGLFCTPEALVVCLTTLFQADPLSIPAGLRPENAQNILLLRIGRSPSVCCCLEASRQTY